MLDSTEFRARRAVSKLTQKALADKLGISREYISKIEDGTLKPTKKIEEKYDAIFGTRRLIVIHPFVSGVDCPYCPSERQPERLSEPENNLNTVWRCRDCGGYFPTRQAYGID